jgi:hypothetical protein
MKNNYFPESLDLDIFLQGDEVQRMLKEPIEGELMNRGEPLGKNLIVRCEDFKHYGDGIEVKYIKSDPDGGFDATTAIEVRLNRYAHSNLIKYKRTGSRHGLGAQVTIHGPGGVNFL